MIEFERSERSIRASNYPLWKRPQYCEHTGIKTRSVVKRDRLKKSINGLVIDIFANWIRKMQMTIKQMKNMYIYNNNNKIF